MEKEKAEGRRGRARVEMSRPRGWVLVRGRDWLVEDEMGVFG